MRDFRDAKAMARTLRQALAAKSVTISNSEALELTARMLGEKGRTEEALTWIERAGGTATPAFVEKAGAFLDASPVPAFRARGRAAIERGAARC